MKVSCSTMKSWARAAMQKVVSALARNRIRRVVIVGVVILAWCSIFIPIITSHLAARERDSTEEVGPNKDVLILADFRRFDPILGKVYLDLYPFANGLDPGVGSLSINLGGENFLINDTIYPNAFISAYPINNRDLAIYPFDEYEFWASLNATDVNGRSLNIDFVFVFEESDFIIYSQTLIHHDSKAYMEYTFKRRGVIKFMCFVIFALIWLLSLAMVNIAIDIVYYRRDTPPEIILVGFTIVFSLPTLRESQPQIPDFGCILDLAGFFWGVIIISSCGCLMLYSWAFRWKSGNHHYCMEP